MSELRDMLRSGMDDAGARVADRVASSSAEDLGWSRIQRGRRTRLAWRGGVAVGAVVAVVAIAVALRPAAPEHFEPAVTPSPTYSLTIDASTPVADAAFAVGDHAVACGDRLTLTPGVTVQQPGVLPAGTTLTSDSHDVAGADGGAVYVTDVDGGGIYPIASTVWDATVTLGAGAQATEPLRLRTMSVASSGEVVTGLVPSMDYATSSATSVLSSPPAGFVQASSYADTAGIAISGSCGSSTDDGYLAGGDESVTLVAQLVDAQGAPVATWVYQRAGEPEALVGPTTLGDVSLACGATLPRSISTGVDVRDLANLYVGTSFGTNGTPISGDPTARAGWDTVFGRVFAATETHSEYTFYATVVVTRDGVIVTSEPLWVFPATTEDDMPSDVRFGASPLLPGVCQAGETTASGWSDGSGVGETAYQVHFAMIAVDASGLVVGSWFDPGGAPYAFSVAHEAGAQVDGAGGA
ncbi:hypothetical protein [Demequina capsici]|uniref:Uncharacterized protein n=1 Tax=Demequina capsici TaxID=3075620 RepID=A0AA96F783_9MICO|nr:hypothetical protein [Demequina sp. OYTSA14]WNM24428.1 hypothetical protein RN606_13850 [Demequina sp. OYTSA14]